jgi:hypothetical protein
MLGEGQLPVLFLPRILWGLPHVLSVNLHEAAQNELSRE